LDEGGELVEEGGGGVYFLGEVGCGLVEGCEFRGGVGGAGGGVVVVATGGGWGGRSYGCGGCGTGWEGLT